MTIRYFTMIALLAAVAGSCGNRTPSRGAKSNLAGSDGAPANVMPVPAVRRTPAQYTYKVVNVYPHDASAYTQGLYWHDGHLWESTGEYSRSDLRKVTLETGKVVERVPVADQYFAEGMALLDNKIYQLTWREGKAFVYDGLTMRKTAEFVYPGEGWGLTTDGEKLYMSDGTNIIRVLDAEDFRRTSTITVMNGRSPVNMLNELEWIDGKIWANVYTTDIIVIIDPKTGQLEGVVDMGGLLPGADRSVNTDVLNGIAYDAATGRIFVTGKMWSKLFEIELVKK